VEEDSYRQSRLCRLLGNPVAFAVVELLSYGLKTFFLRLRALNF
jgi:hypothetical protein